MQSLNVFDEGADEQYPGNQWEQEAHYPVT
jgi:hypothetical protein